MDKKLGFLIAISAITMIMTSGCSSFRGSSQSGAYGSDDYGSSSGASQTSRTGQVSGSSQVNNSNGGGSRRGLFSQQRAPAATAPATCKPCASKPKNTYTYRPAPKPKTVYRAPAKPTYRAPARRPAGQHSQQWYIDRWNRQQQQYRRPKPAARPVVRSTTTNTSTYSGYGNGGYDAGNNSSSTYYDYSSASGTKNTAATTSKATSNKSIYTGSYQQKTYKPYNPKTYTGGSSAKTYSSGSTTVSSSGSASSYTVKKGDTVFEIMRQTGVYWKDIIRINGLTPPYNINPGQIIRLK